MLVFTFQLVLRETYLVQRWQSTKRNRCLNHQRNSLSSIPLPNLSITNQLSQSQNPRHGTSTLTSITSNMLSNIL